MLDPTSALPTKATVTRIAFEDMAWEWDLCSKKTTFQNNDSFMTLRSLKECYNTCTWCWQDETDWKVLITCFSFTVFGIELIFLKKMECSEWVERYSIHHIPNTRWILPFVLAKTSGTIPGVALPGAVPAFYPWSLSCMADQNSILTWQNQDVLSSIVVVSNS